MIVNTEIAKNPLNWVIVALMIAIFMFLVAQLMILYKQSQTAVTNQVAKTAA